MYEASNKLCIKYSTAKSLIQIMKRKGSIIRFFKEKKKRFFKIYKYCLLGKNCKRIHEKPSKILLQKRIDHNNQIIYDFKSKPQNKKIPTKVQDCNDFNSFNDNDIKDKKILFRINVDKLKMKVPKVFSNLHINDTDTSYINKSLSILN